MVDQKEAEARRSVFDKKNALGGNSFQRKGGTTNFAENLSDEQLTDIFTQANIPQDRQAVILANPALRSQAVRQIVSSGLPSRRRATTRTSFSLEPDVRKSLSSAITKRGGPGVAQLVPGLSDAQIQKLAFGMARRATQQRKQQPTKRALTPDVRKDLESKVSRRLGPETSTLLSGMSDQQVQKLAFNIANKTLGKGKKDTLGKRRTGLKGIQLVRNEAFRNAGLKSGERLCMRIK